MNVRLVGAALVLGVVGWLGVAALALDQDKRAESIDGVPAAEASDAPPATPPRDSDDRAEQYVADLVTSLHDSGPSAAADALADLPAGSRPAALRRIETDLLLLSDQVGQNPATMARGLPADGLAAGEPIEVVLTDGTTLLLRVVCDVGCWLAGMTP